MDISYRRLRLACDVTFNYELLIPKGTCNVTCRVTQDFDLLDSSLSLILDWDRLNRLTERNYTR